MKKTTKNNSTAKKLLPAFAMLTVSAITLTSATYAWFSMNKDVTVTGMSVNVQSDSTFLLVKQGTATAAEIQSTKLTEDNAVTATATLYPAAHDDISTSTGITAIEAADETDTTVKDIWYYRYSSDPADYLGTAPSTATYIPTGDIGQYVLINEFSLATAIGSNELQNLRVKSCTITPSNKSGTETAGDQAVKVLVAGANGCEEFSGTGGNGSGTNYLQTANVTSSVASTVKVYIYWDGNDTDVYTNGLADLTSTSVEIELTGDIVAAGS